MYKALVMLIIFVGILFITIEVVRIKAGFFEPKPQITYKYLPRTFEEEQLDPVFVSEIFETMFSQPSPWVLSIRNYDQKKQEKLNQYFITQL